MRWLLRLRFDLGTFGAARSRGFRWRHLMPLRRHHCIFDLIVLTVMDERLQSSAAAATALIADRETKILKPSEVFCGSTWLNSTICCPNDRRLLKMRMSVLHRRSLNDLSAVESKSNRSCNHRIRKTVCPPCAVCLKRCLPRLNSLHQRRTPSLRLLTTTLRTLEKNYFRVFLPLSRAHAHQVSRSSLSSSNVLRLNRALRPAAFFQHLSPDIE